MVEKYQPNSHGVTTRRVDISPGLDMDSSAGRSAGHLGSTGCRLTANDRRARTEAPDWLL